MKPALSDMHSPTLKQQWHSMLPMPLYYPKGDCPQAVPPGLAPGQVPRPVQSQGVRHRVPEGQHLQQGRRTELRTMAQKGTQNTHVALFCMLVRRFELAGDRCG